MSVEATGSYIPVPLVSGIPLEVNASLISESLVGQESPDSLEGNKGSITLQSVYNLPVSVQGSTLVSLTGKLDTPILIPYVTTGLMLYLDAEKTGSGQTWGDLGGNNFANNYMWESLDDYNPGSPYTVVSSSDNGNNPSPGDSIEITGSIALRLDDTNVSGWEDPFGTTYGTKALELNGTSHRGITAFGIINRLNNDDGAAIWRFEDLRQFSIEVWVYNQTIDNNRVFFHIKAEHGIRLQFNLTNERLETILGGSGAGEWRSPNNSFPVDAWYHIIVTVDKNGNAVRLYKNGSSLGWASQGNVNNINTFNNVKDPKMRLGVRWGGNQFKGAIAVVRAYDFPLTPAQVEKNYTAELSRFV